LSIISTKRVDCRDCHRCVRTCPTKAISVEKGQVSIIKERCILCGLCVRSCPQHAKVVIDNTEAVNTWLENGERVVVSLAPAYPAAFPGLTPGQIVAALYKLGFYRVEETAVGAQIVAKQYQTYMQDQKRHMTISSCCPVIVNIIERYFPNLIPALAPSISPMGVHGKLLRAQEEANTRIVFIGPCFAKFTEALEQGDIDAVLTFTQLKEFLETKRIKVDEVSEHQLGDFVQINSRMFPVAQGVLKTFLSAQQMYTQDIVAVEGVDQCFALFKALERGEMHPLFIEAMACMGGCIGGPGMEVTQCNATRRARVIEYARTPFLQLDKNMPVPITITRNYRDRSEQWDAPTEQQIRKILAQTRKFTTADEKDCGGCGYSSCREKAVAVAQGLAEVEMCLPYMRMRAESVSNIIVNYSLSGIIVVDDSLVIREFNPAAEQMFHVSSEQLRGLPLRVVMEEKYFRISARSNKPIHRVRIEYPEFNLTTDQTIIPVKQHGMIIGIIMDVTEEEKRVQELEKVKDQAIQKATEIVNKQMLVAQEIAGLLGETTAETKVALLELISLYRGKEGR
jgi:PAS domain S-box-containing protein